MLTKGAAKMVLADKKAFGKLVQRHIFVQMSVDISDHAKQKVLSWRHGLLGTCRTEKQKDLRHNGSYHYGARRQKRVLALDKALDRIQRFKGVQNRFVHASSRKIHPRAKPTVPKAGKGAFTLKGDLLVKMDHVSLVGTAFLGANVVVFIGAKQEHRTGEQQVLGALNHVSSLALYHVDQFKHFMGMAFKFQGIGSLGGNVVQAKSALQAICLDAQKIASLLFFLYYNKKGQDLQYNLQKLQLKFLFFNFIIEP